MKKISLKVTGLVLSLFIIFGLSSCDTKPTLYFLNWGEYIVDELVTKFEEEYNCHIVMDIVDSNELFYAKIKSGTTAYDVTNPGEYMVEKMYDQDLIQEIDFSKIPNYKEEWILNPLLELEKEMDEAYPGVNKYHLPYFWGSFGVSYNKRIPGMKELIEENDGWGLYFNPSIQSKVKDNMRVGVFSVPRFSYAAAMLYHGLDPNSVDDERLKIYEDTLMNMNISQWGTDILKKEVDSGNLDMAFAYTGDTLDMEYLRISEGSTYEDLEFDVYVPTNTILHCDTFVIPKKARHVELAHQFLNFLYDPDNAFINCQSVGYCSPLISVYKKVVNLEAITPESSEEDIFWFTEWANAVKAHYPMDEEGNMHVNGAALTFLSKEDLGKLESVVNKVKVRK